MQEAELVRVISVINQAVADKMLKKESMSKVGLSDAVTYAPFVSESHNLGYLLDKLRIFNLFFLIVEIDAVFRP